MCGIAGFYLPGTAGDPAVLRRMCDALVHRGPDDDGYLVDGGVGLGMRRLAVIDLVSGHQPILNEDESVAVVLNGEIYNFPELRRRLEARGHRFRTRTDTECVVHLYEEHGDRCVEHLRGMFAFALWDNRRQRVLLARDRVGKKPLYYRQTDEGLWFGSELKALLQVPGVTREVDPVALHHYLTYQYVPAPWSILDGVRKLPPAHTLSVEADGRTTVSRYWRLPQGPKLRLSDAEAEERLLALVQEATRIRLLSDRPVGAFLSGGVDSSVVVAAMAEQSTEPVKTFSIGFEDEAYDERRYAREVARILGTDHEELVVRPSALDVLPALVWHYDEPFADSSAIPSYYLAQLTRDHVTVALNGDGGDESFGGYPRYAAHLRGERRVLPPALLGPARRVVDALPGGSRPRSLTARARRVAHRMAGTPAERYAVRVARFTDDEKAALCTPELAASVAGVGSYDLVAAAYDGVEADSELDRLLHVDVETYLPGDLLVKMDRATMAHSLEARSPLLDHELMEFAARLPADLKLRDGTSKHLLKQVGRRWFPDHVLHRPKKGFGVPMASWLRGELHDLTRDVLCDATARSRGWFRPEAVDRLLAEHDQGQDHSGRVWALVQLELWARMFLDDRATHAPPGLPAVGRTER